jgi:hypothetical protein
MDTHLKPNLLPAAERILLTLWVGALWVAGFIVAPLLFSELDDRALAGSLPVHGYQLPWSVLWRLAAGF